MAGHVYLIGSRKYSWYKIGKSSNAAIRITDLGILLPFRIEVIAVWRVENHHAVERLLHEKFEVNRVNGEWFTFSQAQLKKIVSGMAQVQVPVSVGFTNLPKYAPWEPAAHGQTKAGLEKRFARLIKQKHELKERLKQAEIQTTIQ